MTAVLAVIRRDLLLAVRRKSEVFTVLFFFIIVVSLFPLGIGPEAALLRQIAPGILWVAALLATMLGLARLFAPDHADGTLEIIQWADEMKRASGDRNEEALLESSHEHDDEDDKKAPATATTSTV